jgi:hypothetical protein
VDDQLVGQIGTIAEDDGAHARIHQAELVLREVDGADVTEPEVQRDGVLVQVVVALAAVARCGRHGAVRAGADAQGYEVIPRRGRPTGLSVAKKRRTSSTSSTQNLPTRRAGIRPCRQKRRISDSWRPTNAAASAVDMRLACIRMLTISSGGAEQSFLGRFFRRHRGALPEASTDVDDATVTGATSQ